MEHWFDRLSRPHTRATVLKAALAAGAAAALPALRTPRAWATPTEPCFGPCNDDAAAEWHNTVNDVGPSGCKHNILKGVAVTVVGPLGVGGILLTLWGVSDFESCMASAELKWHREVLKCRGSECGDPKKYPGGKAPKPRPKCSPAQEIECGDICCNNIAECCSCKSGYACCASGRQCGCCGS